MAPVTITATPLDSGVVRRMTIPAALILAVTLGAVGCNKESGGDVTPNSTAPPSVGEGQVVIKGIAFNPKEVHTTVGKPITWTWDDGGLEHSVTADDKSFDSGRKSSGSWPHTFTKAGTIAYHCEVHAKMHGTIVVTG
jgi:plastocyanin